MHMESTPTDKSPVTAPEPDCAMGVGHGIMAGRRFGDESCLGVDSPGPAEYR